ncbi:MAG TPA: hypothetical protein DCL43_05115 [Chitinophagaceae bacterium]|jgi:hypothetical protein|nr:hypothetical protein [Chitinophagaceae bacterium]HAN38069.1 hypothetical protein [Chitinophagaceae bacterium]
MNGNAWNRDLLVLAKRNLLNEQQVNAMLDQLNDILYSVENFEVFCKASEVLDLNKHKIIKKPHLIQQMIRAKELKPFIFICNKN